ncbi:MAG: pitrilysin family protein [Planctomycetota bacterium]
MRNAAICLMLLIALAGCTALRPGARTAAPAGPAPTGVEAPAERPGFVKRTLDNGLVVLCQENHAAPIAVVQAFVRAGSIFEDEYLGAGISHYCEHLIAGGSTTNRSEEETEDLLDSLGGANNAYTSYDDTSYFIRTTKDKFPQACQLLADWMQNAAFKPKEVRREYEVIQREIEKGQAEPNRVLWKLADRTMFEFHPMKHPVIGHLELFKRLTREDLVKYYERMYRPDNMVVVAVGEFDAAKTADHIASLFEDAERSGRVVELPRMDPPQQGTRRATAEMDVRSAYVMMCFRTVPLSHPDLYPLDVMSYVLSHGRSSRLVRRLREEEQLVDSVASWSYTPWFGGGNFAVKMVLKPENIEAAEAAALDELNRLKTELVSGAELERAKKQKVAEDVFVRQTIEAQARELGGNYLATGNPFFSQVYLRGIRKVRADEIRAVARKYLTTDNLTVAVVRPKTDEPKTADAAEQETASAVEKITLPNGLRVLVKRNPAVPIVSMQAYFLGGVLREDEGTAGTSHVLGQMLTRGTESRSALEIARTFDALGGSISGGSGNNTVFLKASTLAEDFEGGFEVFADCLANPAFPADELDKAKRLTLNAIERQDDNWHTEAYNLLRSTLYTKSPYRLNKLGTKDSVSGISRADLAAFHARAFTGRNGVVAIFGDIDPARAKELVTNALGSLPEGQSILDDIPAEPPLTEDRVATRHNQRPNAAVVYAAYPATTITDVEDRYPLLVLDGVMSGVGWPGGWLHGDLRGAGLVYVVHAYAFHGLRTPGFFGVYALTRPDKVGEVRSIIDKNIERAKSGPVPKDEFERAKEMAVTVELLGRQTNGSLATQAALDELYGLGHDFGDTFAERVRSVTRADVLRVAKKYLDHRALVVVKPERK